MFVLQIYNLLMKSRNV